MFVFCMIKSGHVICFLQAEAEIIFRKELEHKGTIEAWLVKTRDDGEKRK